MKIYHKYCKHCNSRLRLVLERLWGICLKCAKEINADAMNTIRANLKDPKKMKQVEEKCKKKGLNKEEIEKGIATAKKISTK